MNRGTVTQRQGQSSGLNPDGFSPGRALVNPCPFICKWQSQQPPCKVLGKTTGRMKVLMQMNTHLTPGSFILGEQVLVSPRCFQMNPSEAQRG